MEYVFSNIIIKKKWLNKIVVAITMLAITLGLILPESWVASLLTPIAIFLILVGIPHGATDFIIFQQIFDKNRIGQQVSYFIVGYLIVTLVYLAVWYAHPLIAFALFIANSIYHFGESNWAYLKVEHWWKSAVVYTIWGAAILGIPIMLHFEEAAVIIYEITGANLTINTTIRAGLVYLLCFGNFVTITSLLDLGIISKAQFQKELRNFLLLVILFFCTPLLIGFGIYFVFWHSAYAFRDQFKYLDLAQNKNRKRNYLIQLVLITLISFVGIGLIYLLANDYMNQGYNLGKLFVFIAVVTAPHSLLMHCLYQFNVFQEKKRMV